MNSISKTTSMGTIAGAALAAAGLGQSGTATAARVAPASTPMVTLWIGVNDDGNGHFVVGDYVVYASDSGDNGGLASYDINLGGVSTISNYSPHGYYDDGTGCGTDNELGFTYGRTFNNVSPVSASQDTLPYGQSYPVIFVYGFGQTAGNLGNDAAPGSTGPDGSATQAVYGAPLLLVKGTYFYNPNHPAPPTLTNWGSDSVTVFQTNSGNATEAATLDFTRVTVVPGGSHSALLSVMTSGTSSPAYIGTRNPGTAGNSSAITLAKNGTDYVPGLLNNISPTFAL